MAVVEDTFRERFQKLWAAWGSGTGFGGAGAVAVATGVFGQDDDIGYLKSFALVTWLFGAELQGAAVVLGKKEALLVFAEIDYPGLRMLATDGGGAERPKIAVMSAAAMDDVKKAIHGLLEDAKSVAVLTKEMNSQEGPMAEAVNAAAKEAGTLVNVAPALGAVLAVKDDTEKDKVKKASILTAAVMKVSLTQRIEKIIDQDKKVSHSKLADVAENAIVNPDSVNLKRLRADLCDPCYPPIIQSADAESKDRKFDLRPSAESSNENLRFGCILASVGARYNFYCSNVSRTLFVNPSKTQGAVYAAVLKAQEAAISALIPGAPLKSAHAAAVKALQTASAAEGVPDLVPLLTKNVGFGMGIEFRDSAFVLNAKSDTLVKVGMMFNVTVGVQGLVDKENGPYCVLIGDTVHVRESKLGPECFTTSCRKDFLHISYELRQDDEEEEEEAVDDGGRSRGANAHKEKSTRGKSERGGRAANDEEIIDISGGDVIEGGRGRRRGVTDNTLAAESEEAEQRRRRHQDELAQKMLDRGRARLEGGEILTFDDVKAKRKKLLDEYRAYVSPSDFPSTRPRQLCVDMEAEAVLVPINGVPVPFHITTIKNASKSDEGQYSYLRINFHAPQSVTKAHAGIGRVSDNAPKFPEFEAAGGKSAAYIKELSFRASNPQNLSDCLRKIKELRKRATEKLTEALEKQSLVAQQSLVVERRQKVAMLSDVAVRPPMAKGKNNIGILEAHTNGFRFRCRTGSIDIIYANIRNAFFQEADREVLVILHFHLKNDIMVGKKKTKDVQFYVEVMEAAVKLNDKRRRQFDQDELEEEQRERELKNRTNKNFLRFTKEVDERYDLEFDIPYRQLAFTGAPKSAAVNLVPTVSCIVDLVEWPPFVLNLDDVEIAHFERVIFQLRMFDLVFIFKGFEDEPSASGKASKDMWQRISSIPMEELTPLKKYLDEQNIKFYEGPANLQWNEVLKKVRQDLEGFYEDGGWNFLSLEGPGGGGEDGSDDEDEDSLEGDVEFAPSGSDAAFGSAAESSEEDSDASLDVAQELEGDSDEGEDELSSDEEGLEWDELENKAKAEDMRKGRGSDDENGGSRRNRTSNRGGSSRKPSSAGGNRKSGGSGGNGRRMGPPAGKKRGRNDR